MRLSSLPFHGILRENQPQWAQFCPTSTIQSRKKAVDKRLFQQLSLQERHWQLIQQGMPFRASQPIGPKPTQKKATDSENYKSQRPFLWQLRTTQRYLWQTSINSGTSNSLKKSLLWLCNAANKSTGPLYLTIKNQWKHLKPFAGRWGYVWKFTDG